MHGVHIEIRLLAEGEIDLLEKDLAYGPPQKHRERFALQEAGEAVYLVAWQGGLPLGHVLVTWAGTADKPMASRLRDCPDISDLFVHPDHRSKGIGSLLLDSAEEMARRRGYSRIGLGVGIDNPRARSLYERRGYADAGFGEYEHGVSGVDRQGRLMSRTEICTYLVKQLRQ